MIATEEPIVTPALAESDISAAEEAEQFEQEAQVPASALGLPLKIVIGSSFLLRLAGGATGILLAAYLKRVVGAQADMIGLLGAIFYLSELLLSPIFGALSDLKGRRFLLVLGPLVGAIALPFYPLTTAFIILCLGRVLEGVSTAAKTPSALGYLADATTGKSKKAAEIRGRVMGMYEISFLVGLVAGSVLGGLLDKAFGTGGFYVLSLVYLAAAALLFFFVPETLPEEARKHHAQAAASSHDAAHPVRALLGARVGSYLHLLKQPTLLSFVPAWLAINAVVGLWSTHIQPRMIQGRGADLFPGQMLDGKFDTIHVSYAVGAFGLMFMVGIYGWSRVYARIRKTTIMIAATGGLFLVCLSLLAINNSWLPFHEPVAQWPLALPLMLGLVLVSGFTPVALAFLAEISEHHIEHRGAVMGLYSVLLGIGQLVGGAGGGFFIKDTGLGFNGIVLGSFLLGVVAFVTVLRLRSKYRV